MYVSQHEGWIGVHAGQPGILDRLPVGVYKVGFDMQRGFMLLPSESESAIMSDDAGMLGCNAGKERKILDAYRRRKSSTGVLLSGDRGLGKTMLLRRVARLVLTELKLPVIVISTAYEGIAEFLSVINQEYMLIIDEMEKVFEGSEQQDSLLTVLDGVCSYKRLVVATCNDTMRLTAHMFGRPNRFYYHLEFEYPTFDDAIRYLKDRGVELDDERQQALRLETMIHPFNYDILSALAAELSAGYPLGEALDDLNSDCHQDDSVQVDVHITLEGGAEMKGTCYLNPDRLSVDNINRGTFTVHMYGDDGMHPSENPVSFRIARVAAGALELEVVEHRQRNALYFCGDIEKTLGNGVPTFTSDDGDRMIRVVSAVGTLPEDQWRLRYRTYR